MKRGPDGRIINPNYYTRIEHDGRTDDSWRREVAARGGTRLREHESRIRY